MENNLIIIFATLALTGCGTTKPVINTVIQKVEIPIAVPCKATVPAKPDFNFDKLVVEKDLFDKSKAALADRQLHLAYEAELLVQLNGCIKK